MKTRAVLAVVLCNLIAFLLLTVAAFLFIHFTTPGHFALDMSKESSADLASKYGDPLTLLERGGFYLTWVFGSAMAFLLGAIAALIFRRPDWRVSTLSVVLLICVLASPISVARILNGILYIAMSWLAMYLLPLWRARSHHGQRSG